MDRWRRESRRLLAASVVLLFVVAARQSPAAAAGTSCTTSADCPLPGAPCELCPGGTTACPLVSCVSGQCSYSFPSCPATCPAGQTWCSINGRCTDLACLSCCQFANTCTAAKDCGNACVTCPNGSSSCTVGQCGTNLAGQCFYPEPVCPAATSSV